jgi:hypothetical protein
VHAFDERSGEAAQISRLTHLQSWLISRLLSPSIAIVIEPATALGMHNHIQI